MAWRLGLAVPVLAAASVLAGLLGLGAWLAWRGLDGLAKAAWLHPVVPAAILVLLAFLVVRHHRRRKRQRAAAAGLLVVHRLWANLDALSQALRPGPWNANDARPMLLPLLDDVPRPTLGFPLRERLVRTDALLAQFVGIFLKDASLPAGHVGWDDLRLRRALAHDAMQAMLEDFVAMAGGAAPSTVSVIAKAQSRLRQASLQHQAIEIRVSASEALPTRQDAVLLLCWHQDRVLPGGDVVALGG